MRIISVGPHAQVEKPRRRKTATCLLCGRHVEANQLAKLKCGEQIGPMPTDVVIDDAGGEDKPYFD